MKIFISHSSNDVAIAQILIELIRSALNVPALEIRCTSVNGYRLPIGVSTEERLKQEVLESSVLVGVISASSMQSHYVLFELGARWGKTLPIFPIVCSPKGFELLSGPLSGINSLDGTDEGQLQQFVHELGTAINHAVEQPQVYGQILVQLAKACQESSDQVNDAAENVSETIELLKKEKLQILGHDYTLLEIFRLSYREFGIGAFRDDISRSLIELTKSNSGPSKFTSGDENDFIIGELITLGILTRVDDRRYTHPQYFLSDFGKQLVKRIRIES